MALDGKQVFEIIHSIAADLEHKDEITVLPLMCGSGKSTAISYLIRQTIEESEETGNGLLVVTDRKDRMEDYMKPYDDELCGYLMQNQDKIVIMTHENIQEAHNKKYFVPVLMMTTQRYFHLSTEEIEEYLIWKGGRRALIVIDERPELITTIDLDARKLSECKVAIENSFQHEYMAKPTNELDATIKFFNEFTNQLRYEEKNDKDNLHCFWSWYTEENRNTSMLYADEFMNGDYAWISKHREEVNGYGGGTYYDDIFTRLKAIRQLRNSNALLSQTRNKLTSNLFYTLYSLLDNYELIRDVNAKVVILDGTADLSPDYLPARYVFKNEFDVKRPLKNLHIKLVNISTGKTAMFFSPEMQERVVDCAEMYINEVIETEGLVPEKDIALFTYKGFENTVKRRIKRITTEHFGNIKGKNDFREVQHIVQIGINRFPDEVYYLYFLLYHPDILDSYENMEKAYNHTLEYDISIRENEGKITESYDGPGESIKNGLDFNKVVAQSMEIESQMKEVNGETASIMNHILLAELEQNLFRGIIRNSNCETDFFFHLFINTNNYKDLIKLMRERYEPLGASIEITELPFEIILQKIMNRHGNPYNKKLLAWHDTELKNGQKYTPADIRNGIGMCNKSAIKSYEQMLSDNPVIRVLLSEEKAGKRGEYIKKQNWIL